MINTFDELEGFLSEWVNFNGEGDHDLIGIMILLRACLRNIKDNCDLSVLNELNDFFSNEELIFLKELILTIESANDNSP